jgi:formate hydrogenlyase subunit 6/NADH:ubiquinone oxidoreductase subunit I
VKALRLGSMLRDVLRALFKKPVTVQYLTKPGEMVPVPDRFRGKIVYDKNACVGCLLCIRTCPSGVITATAEKKVKFDVVRCMFCGQCVETCPKKAIALSSDFEMVVHEKEGLVVQ